MTGRGRRDDDPVEGLHLPEPLQRVDGRAPTLDARVDGDTRAPRRELDGLEDRHRSAELAVLHRRLKAVLERHDEEIRRNENLVLGARDPEGRVEHDRVELLVGERHEQAGLARSALGGTSAPGEPHGRSSSRSAR